MFKKQLKIEDFEGTFWRFPQETALFLYGYGLFYTVKNGKLWDIFRYPNFPHKYSDSMVMEHTTFLNMIAKNHLVVCDSAGNLIPQKPEPIKRSYFTDRLIPFVWLFGIASQAMIYFATKHYGEWFDCIPVLCISLYIFCLAANAKIAQKTYNREVSTFIKNKLINAPSSI